MSEGLDERIRSLVVELVEASPPPHPVFTVVETGPHRPSPLTLRSGLARMAVVAVAVLLVGVAGAWIGRDLVPLADVTELSVRQGVPSPEPEFSTTEFGARVDLLPSGGDIRPDVVPGTLDGEVVAVGRIEDTDLEVFTWHTTDPVNGTCVQVIGFRARHSVCGGGTQPAPDIETPFAFPRLDEATAQPIDVVAVWKVPDGTSVVRVVVGDTARWQRPIEGVAAFTFEPDAPLALFDALDADGESIGGTGFSPQHVANPAPDAQPQSEPTVVGADEDLIAIPDSHPALLLIEDGATSYEEFVEVAEERQLEFTCASGGGFPTWELCLVRADGVLAVVPFENPAGNVARITAPSLSGEVLIPLDIDHPVGVRSTGGGVIVEIEYLGDKIGSMRG